MQDLIIAGVAFLIGICIEIWINTQNKKEESEKDKTYRALRYLIYIIIALILIGITIKILLFYSILSL